MITKPILLIAMLALAACSGEQQIVVRAAGVGPITSATPCDVETIAALLPGKDATTIYAPRRGGNFMFILVLEGSNILMEIGSATPESGTVAQVSVLSPKIPDKNGVRVGMKFSDVYPAGAELRCLPLSDEISSNMSCRAIGMDHVFYEFSGTWDGPDNADSFPFAVAESKIVAIHWDAAAY